MSKSLERFRQSLYYRKHGFFFGNVDLLSHVMQVLILYFEGEDKFYFFIKQNDWIPRLQRNGGEIDESVIDDFMVSMPHLIDNIVEEIEQFREKGIEHCFFINICHLTTVIVLLNARREDEEKSTLRYLNMTTIATFFSSVSATTLQFTFGDNGGTLSKIVNLCWFISILSSVASGMNSLLGLTWRRSSV